MLKELYIENFVIIKKEHLFFSDGFNVLTGETGSGKSLILDCIALLLGRRLKKENIGKFSDKTIIEGVFSIDSEDKRKFLENLDISFDENNLIITRTFTKKSSIIRINGRVSTLQILKEISEILIDTYNQNDSKDLTEKSNYINLIDKYKAIKIIDNYKTDDKTKILRKKLRSVMNEKAQLEKKLKMFELDDEQTVREIDLLTYQKEDIEQIDIDNVDEEELNEEYKKLSVATELKKSLSEASEKISGNNFDIDNISSLLGSIDSSLQDFLDINEINSFYNRISEIEDLLNDLERDISYYNENLEYDEENFQILDNKISKIFDLKRKYGHDLKDIKNYYLNIISRISELKNIDKNRENILNNIKIFNKDIEELSNRLHDIRIEKSKDLEERVNQNIRELNIENGLFKVDIKKSGKINETGFDIVDFLIRTNKGEELKSLDSTASGGEISRIMLAFKTIYSDFDDVDTLIFDEIDQGISGRTAQVVAEKIETISKRRQVIVISHLPQISSFADNHILIYKKDDENKTISSAENINGEKRIKEIARLIGGVNITETTYKSAKEMIDMANEKKGAING